MTYKKQPVSLRPFDKSRYALDKLRVCRKCGTYTALWEESCTACHKGTLISLTEKAASLTKRTMWKEIGIAAVFLIAAVALSEPGLQTLLTTAGSLLLLGLLIWLQRRMREGTQLQELRRLILKDQEEIREGLKQNRKRALAELKENRDAKLTYEMLREVAVLVHNDRIRLQQVALLQSFLLRKDMPLEIEPLLIEAFDPDLAAYIGEVALLKRELIRTPTLRYITTYEPQILKMAQGEQILTRVAAAAIRKRRYVSIYSEFILRYAGYLPPDRLRRLYLMVRETPDYPWGRLSTEIHRIYAEHTT